MEFKHLITHFTYRIEPKPEGGFIACATHPIVPPLEAPTREELQQKIQANIAAALRAQFPALKLPLENRELKFSFHIEPKPGGGFTLHSADPNTAPIEGAAHEIEGHFAEKLISFMGNHFMPELSRALAAQGNSGDVKVFVDQKTSFTVNTGPQASGLGMGSDIASAGPIQPSDATNASFGIGGTIDNSLISSKPSRISSIIRFLLALLIITAVLYFLRHC